MSKPLQNFRIHNLLQSIADYRIAVQIGFIYLQGVAEVIVQPSDAAVHSAQHGAMLLIYIGDATDTWAVIQFIERSILVAFSELHHSASSSKVSITHFVCFINVVRIGYAIGHI